jgi:hypothetical protein
MKPLLDKHWWHRYNVYPITIYVFGLGDSMTEIHVNSCKHQEEFEDIKEVIKIRKSKKDKQHNDHGQQKKDIQHNDYGQQKKDKRTTTIYKTLHRKLKITRTSLKTGWELRCSGRVSSLCSTNDIRRVTVKRHEHHRIWKSSWIQVYVNRYKKNKTSGVIGTSHAD